MRPAEVVRMMYPNERVGRRLTQFSIWVSSDVNPNDIVFEDHDFNKDRDKYCHKFFRERGEAHFAKSGKFATREEAAAFDRESYELNLPSCMKSLHAPSDMPCTMNIWFWQEGEAWANEQPPKVARPRKKQKTQ